MEDRGGIMGGFVKSLGMGNQKVVWALDSRFDPENYFSIEWFDPSVEMYPDLKNELNWRANQINMDVATLKKIFISNRSSFYCNSCQN